MKYLKHKFGILAYILAFVSFLSPVSVVHSQKLSSAQEIAADTVQSSVTEETEKYLDIQIVTSKSGVVAWLVEDHSIPVLSMQYVFRNAGAKNDPVDKQGLARLVANTMDEGSSNLDSHSFQKMLRDYAITLQFSASRDHFSGKLKTLSKNKHIAFNLLKNALTSPRFDKEPVDRMRFANKSRINASSSKPNWIVARIQNDVIFEGHPYAMNSGGTLSGLDSITRADLKDFHQTLGRNQLVIGVAGNITASELSVVLDEVFGTLPVVESNTLEAFDLKNSGETFVYEMDIPQTIVNIAQKGVRRSDDDYYAGKIMNFILGESGFGSRLMEEVREKRGLTYGIYSYFIEYEDTPVFHISTSTANQNVPELLELINAEIKDMKTQPISEEELREAQSYLIGSLPLSLTSTHAIADVLTALQLEELPVNYLDMRADKLRTVSIADVQVAAQRILDEASFTSVLVGAPEGVDNFKTVTTLPNVE